MSTNVDVIQLPAPPSSTAQKNTYHIYFIPGNPGLISYYTPFLNFLHARLNSATSSILPKHSVSTSIYGESLGGFEVNPVSTITCPHRPLSLRAQIEHVHTRVTAYYNSIGSSSQSESTTTPKLILIGHSVGAYIALEVLRRHASTTKPPEIPVISAILLFPTVTHIAASPNGLKFAWLLRLPHLPSVVGYLASGLAWTLGPQGLRTVCKLALGMTDEAAATTAAFLGSWGGVGQALYMARDEMLEITEDRWDEDIWGSLETSSTSRSDSWALDTDTHTGRTARPKPLPRKLFFYFGQADHWVADHTRDELMASRGFRRKGYSRAEEEGERDALLGGGQEPDGVESSEWRPWMEIDESGIPHGFCIWHNEPVALKVQDFIEEVVKVQAL